MIRLLENRPLHIAIILLACVVCYLPGINSLFVFDDLPNLEALIHIQGATPADADFWEFVFSGGAGPTGRPLSLFTFALQSAAWPDNPAAFKAINLLIHCMNAVLVYLLGLRLAVHLQGESRRACLIAVCAALVWSLHPVHTSSVLYAIQRMGLLSNLFMLAGIYGYVHIRLMKTAGQARQLLMLTACLAGSGLLALFSKENAPSLVFYVLVLEYTLLKDVPAGKTHRQWRLACLWLPALVCLLLPLVFFGQLQVMYEESRSFGMLERLLTQSRILFEYLTVILVPTTAATGIFHDFTVSASLFNPPSTLAAVLAWTGLAGLFMARPGKHGIWLFALGWYLAGHVVESSVLPLELFFHHRNYLAFFGIIFALTYAFFTWLPATLMRGNLRPVVACIYLLLLALNTVRISSLWAQPLQLAEQWYEAEPATARNAEFYAMQLAQQGNEGEQLAAAVLASALDGSNDKFHLLLNLATLDCVNPNVRGPDQATLLEGADNLSVDNRNLVSPVQQIVQLRQQGGCPDYDEAFLEDLLARLAAHSSTYDRGMFQFELARIRNAAGDADAAMSLMESAYANAGDPGILFNLAIQLINAGRYAEALEAIDRAIADIRTRNNIRSGTRSSKLETLGSMREDVLGFMAGNRAIP